MKHHTVGILGYLFVAIAYIGIFSTKQCISEVIRPSYPPNTNATLTKHADHEILNRDNDEDDFVPYRGERFSVFDWLLFKATSKQYSGNVLLSPISLKIALVLLYEGAQQKTGQELAEALQLPATPAATREKFSTILRSFEDRSASYNLNIGTRIYIDSNITIRQRYEAIVKTFYNTDVISANLSNAKPLVKEINSWVSNVTDANIDRMIEDESSVENSLMLIMNAFFFKGSWRRKYFAPQDTRIEKFHTSDNQTVAVPFMHTVGRFYYSESSELNAKILRIPYYGNKFAIYLLLPNALDGIEKLVNEINPSVLTKYVWLMQDLPIDVSIPKFKFQFSSHLEPILRKLGIRDIFDDTATLTGIARSRRISKHLKVSDIVQKAGIEVNENGTTAYVATEIEIGNKIEDETFHANRPFVFYIEDESTGTVIYVGKIMNPLDTTSSTASPNELFPSKSGSQVPGADSMLQAGLDVGDRNNLFNVFFSQALNKESENGNLVASPASIKAALTMLMDGANGDTKSELVSTLRLPENESRRRQIMERVLASLKRKDNGTEIDFAIRLWIDKNLRVLDSYKNIVQSSYQGDIKNVNFKESQNTASLINDWVRRATHNAISSPSLLNDIPSNTRLISTSVIYFKGRWLKSFDKNKTKLQCFYTPNGKCENTYFMTHQSTYRYAYISSIEAHALEIPYSDGRTSMVTLMPNTREKDPYLKILSEDLTSVPISAILANLKIRDVTIHIPKFSIESNLNLLPTLQHMGIKSIFQTNANFTEMISNGSLRVTNILQNVKVEIDEEGTLAAAVTEIGYQLLSLWGNEIKFDRPFLFMIVDSVTNATLFSGRFIVPT
ncbi:Serine protease inhibitor 2 [Anthophora plagiata]